MLQRFVIAMTAEDKQDATVEQSPSVGTPGKRRKNDERIANLAESDRPREKLLAHGPQVLTNAELVALLLNSGNTELSALQLARALLAKAENNLYELSRFTVADFAEFKGVGPAKSATLMAALELGRRKQMQSPLERPVITGSADAAQLLQAQLTDLTEEQFWLLLLNRKNGVLRKEQISVGGRSATVADLKVIFQRALHAGASGIIMAHNHPSGNLKPSAADRQLTKRAVESGKLLDLPVLDHLIIAGSRYYSFADEGEV